jgi:glycosyltransferase involved in cell wall biosynthesis
MAKVLFIIHDVVGSSMAGPGIRALELVRVLAREHAVTLAMPQAADALPAGITGFVYTWGDAASLAPALADAELIVANGQLLEGHPELLKCPVPLALDLYDPTMLENLALWRGRAATERIARSQQDIQLFVRQLRAGDCFLCATERQRDLYLGALLALGRVEPQLADADPTLRGLLRVVPFGLPDDEPVAYPPPWQPIADEQVILWSGGLWDWLDPLTLIRAMPQVLASVPNARLVFLAGKHPNHTVNMTMPQQARDLAAELGLSAQQVTFVDEWVPYTQRSGALLAADLVVYLHHASLESEYAAVRSRFLDHLWAGVPSVVSAGDAASSVVEQHGLGRSVPPGDVQATAKALVELLSDKQYLAQAAQRSRELAAEYRWERVAEPLLEFCRNPRRSMPEFRDDAPLAYVPEQAPIDIVGEGVERAKRAAQLDQRRNTKIDQLRQNYHISEPAPAGGLLGKIRHVLISQFVRPLVVPMFEQQNRYNAAVVHAIDALAEHADTQRTEQFAASDLQTNRLMHYADTGDLRRQASIQNPAMLAVIERLEQQIADLNDQNTKLAEQIAKLQAGAEQER